MRPDEMDQENMETQIKINQITFFSSESEVNFKERSGQKD